MREAWKLALSADVAQRLQQQFCKLPIVGSSPTVGSIASSGRPFMQSVRPKWRSGGLALVCDRCSAERIPEETPEIAARHGECRLRDWLKSTLKERGRWGPIRAISTSCMDVCAKGLVTVCIAPSDGRESEVLVVDPLEDRERVYDRILELLGERGETKTTKGGSTDPYFHR